MRNGRRSRLNQLLIMTVLGAHFFVPISSAKAKPFLVTDIAGGWVSSCALSKDQVLKCWGSNREAQLGIGSFDNHGLYPNSMGRNLPPVDLGLNFHVIDFALGYSHSCALSNMGDIKCWGLTTLTGHETSGGSIGGEPHQMGEHLKSTDLGHFKAIGLTLNRYHSCAWSDDGRAKCWGLNEYGELGLPIDPNRRIIGDQPGSMGERLPILPLPYPVTAMTTGFFFSCAVAASNIYCWGGNFGVLGLGLKAKAVALDPEVSKNTKNIVYLEDKEVQIKVIDLRSSNVFTCALYQVVSAGASLSKRKLKCWGSNYCGELGIGKEKKIVGDSKDEMGSALPEVQLGMADIEDFALGSNFGCAKDFNGRVKCWGFNGRGNLGLGDLKDRGSHPRDLGQNLPYIDLGLPVLKLARTNGASHMCAILVNQAVKCWGDNAAFGSTGALGVEMNVDSIGGSPSDMGDNLPFVNLTE